MQDFEGKRKKHMFSLREQSQDRQTDTNPLPQGTRWHLAHMGTVVTGVTIISVLGLWVTAMSATRLPPY